MSRTLALVLALPLALLQRGDFAGEQHVLVPQLLSCVSQLLDLLDQKREYRLQHGSAYTQHHRTHNQKTGS